MRLEPRSRPDVVVGDRLQVVEANGSLGYEDVYLLTHKDATIASRYLEIGLASGQSLTLSPRHFIPVAPGGQGSWESHVLKGADEVKAGDVVWHAQADGTMAPAEVTTVSSRTEVGAFNPLTLSGTIVVDGVVASAHSNWFLDGIVAADTQGKVYQAMFAPVRATYRLIGPDWTREISERWGVVDFVRENTPQTAILAAVIVVSSIGAGVALRRRRAAAA